MFCPKCGATLDDDAKFCSKCGKKISSDNENIEPKKCLDSAIDDNQDINQSKRKISRNKRTIIITTAFVCLIVVVLIILLLTKNNDKSEKNIEKSIEKEEITKEEITKEEKTTDSSSTELEEFARQYYDDFLEYYKEQEAQGFTQKDLELINPIFSDPAYFPGGYDKELYYTVIDLANDGIPELFISDMQTIYGAYRILESDGQICNLLGDIGHRYLGDRVMCDICANGVIKETRIKNDLTNATTFYQVEKSSSELKHVEGLSLNEGEYFRVFSGGKEAEEINQDRYNEIINQYSLKEDIEWLKLSEYKNNNRSLPDENQSYKSAYLGLIHAESSSPLAMHYYFLADIDKNGIPELIIAKGNTGDMIMCYVYSYISQTNSLQQMGTISAPLAECYEAKSSSGVALLMRFAGVDNAVMLTIEDNILVQEDSLENEENEISYYRSQNAIQRYEINDYSPLENKKTMNDNVIPATYKVVQSEILGSKYEIIDFDMQATSTLQEIGYDHDVNVLRDQTKDTCWAEGVSGYGIGEKILFASSERKNVNALFIKPGFTKSEKDFNNNGCPTIIKIKCGDTEGEADLSNFEYSEDSFLIVEFGKTFSVNECSVTIEDIRQGNKYEDTCITELYFLNLP